MIAYGKDEVREFGDLHLVRAQLDNGKVLERDVLRDVDLRRQLQKAQERTLSLERERGHDCGWDLSR